MRDGCLTLTPHGVRLALGHHINHGIAQAGQKGYPPHDGAEGVHKVGADPLEDKGVVA